MKCTKIYAGVRHMSNYPAGCENTTDDPRSPFYVDPPECDECGGGLIVDVDCDEEGFHNVTHCEVCDAT